MKFISTVSAIELNVNINTPVALLDVCNREDVLDFFEDADAETIIDYIESVNDMDAETLRSSLAHLLVDDDMKIEVDLAAIPIYKEETASRFGKATITRGGGFGGKDIAITDGITVVSDVLTQNVADFFASSVESLKNMNIFINDSTATLDSVLHEGDIITLESRKAGEKGCGTVSVDIEDAEGNCRSFSYPVNSKISDVLEHLSSDRGNTVFGEDATYNELVDDLDAVDDAEVTRGLLGIVLNAGVTDVTKLSFLTYIFRNNVGCMEDENDNDYDYQDEDKQEDTEVEEGTEVLTGPATGAMGSAKIMSTGGWTEVEVSIVNGVTKLKDVVVTNKVLNKFAMTDEQALSLVPSINDNPATMNDVLHTGDIVILSARKAGEKGNN